MYTYDRIARRDKYGWEVFCYPSAPDYIRINVATFNTEDEAAAYVNYLNGGTGHWHCPPFPKQVR